MADPSSITPELDARKSLSNLFDLSGQVAFVPGGYGGLGEAIAYGLALQGARVVVAGRDVVYAIGTHHAYRLTWDGSRLEIDRDWQPLYRTRPDAEQSYGWDAVIADGSAWFLDNGDNIFTRSFRGGGVASGPIHLVRIALDAPGEVSAFAPFGLPHGTVANPPLVDPSRRIVVAFDSGNARIGAFRYGPRVGDPYTPLWEHAFGAANHFLLDEANGQVVVDDFDGEQEHAVVLDVESGIELGRAATGSAVQSVVFQAAGFDRDAYCCSFLSVARIFADGRSDSQGGLER